MDQSHTVQIAEFVNGCMRLSGHANNVDMATLIEENRTLIGKVTKHMKKLHQKVDQITSTALPGVTLASLRCCQHVNALDMKMSEWFALKFNSIDSTDIVLNGVEESPAVDQNSNSRMK